MSISKLPSGRWRAQVYRQGKNVSLGTYATKREAKAAREAARQKMCPGKGVTVSEFRDRWLSDALFARPKESTRRHNAERTKAFAARYGDLELDQVTDQVVGEWLAGGSRNGSVPALRAMFNDAASAKAGRLVERNPFAGLGLRKSRGNRDNLPPSEEQVWEIIRHARALSGPSFSAWLQVACFTGMRPGELDALRWSSVDLGRGRIVVREQFNGREFTSPKNGLSREALILPPARDALVALPRMGDFVFTSLRGTHWTASARAYHWKAIRAAAGWDGSLYLATRHFAGWYMRNVLDIPAEDVAIALGHTDGGILVTQLYGHRETERALDRVAAAYARVGNVQPLRVVDKREIG